MGILDKLKKKKNVKEELAEMNATSTSDKKKESAFVDKEKTEVTKKVVSKKAKTGDAYRILVRPIISEKALTAETLGSYTFEVALGASKVAIKQVINQVYGVMPKTVRVMNVEGKKVRFGRKFGKRKSWKKAIVTLPKGRTINIHEGV